MRDFKSMKRQRGRNRSGGPGGGSGGKPQQNANRAFESNGPDNLKIRGHAQHVYEKYQQLARDAMSAGDRVLGENFLQHAEHYFRLIRTLQPNRPYTDIVSREGFASGYDIDFEDEGGEGGEEQFAEGGESQPSDERGGDYRDQQPRQDRWENRGGEGRSDQNRQDQNRQGGGERQDYNRDQNRPDQNRQDQNRPDQNRQGGYANGRNNGGGGANGGRDRNFSRDRNDRWENRSDQNRDGQNRDGQTRDQGERTEAQSGEDRRPERQDRFEQNRPEREGYGRREGAYGERPPQNRDPLPVIEPQAAPLTAAPAAEAPAVETVSAKPARTRVLRSRDGDESHTPAFLQAAAPPAPAAAEEAPVKRPRGRPKKVEAAPSEAEDV
jgi:hypothetical protein